MGYVTDKFSKRLKELRETAGLTQEQLAKELKVSRGAISYYEKGSRTPDIEFLESVSMFFDFPVDYILGYTNNIKEEHRNMYEFYGLTDEACTELENDDTLGHIFSHIATNPSFLGIRHLIDSMVKDYKNYSETNLDYLAFLIVGSLKKLIFEAVQSEMYDQYTENDKIELSKEIEELNKKYGKYKEELAQEEAAIQAEIKQHEENREKQLTEIRQSTRYISRKKVHDKLRQATLYLDND